MASRYTITGLADGTLTSSQFISNPVTAYVETINFNDDSGDPINPTSGVIDFEYSTGDDAWHNIGQVDLAKSSSHKPRISGQIIRQVRATLSGFEPNVNVNIVLFASSEPDANVSTELTSSNPDTMSSRIKVDAANISFFEGREFRVSIPLSVPLDTEFFIKYVAAGDTILTTSQIEIDQGGIEYTVWSAEQATELTPFNDTVDVYPASRMSFTPTLDSHVQVFSGGTVEFTGEPNTTKRVRTASGNGARVSVVSGDDRNRGFPATTVYVRVKPLPSINQESFGVIEQEWVDVK